MSAAAGELRDGGRHVARAVEGVLRAEVPREGQRPGRDVTPITRAPAATAIWTADRPTPPQPCTATHSPARTRPTWTTARNAVA